MGFLSQETSMKTTARSWFERFSTRSRRPRYPIAAHPQLEALEDRTVPTIDLTSGTLTLTGTNNADSFRICLMASDTTRIEVSDDNGANFQNFALSTVNQVNVNGLGGNDTLTLDLANGLIAGTGTTGL